MSFSDFSSSAAPVRASSTLRLPQPITPHTGCALAFLPLQAADLLATLARASTSSPEPRRNGRDVHQGSYYAQCRVAMGY
ncbi:hypothetical protein Q5H93_06850 [Hymenobacter sp. ASUV-10]|uniref:Uncharacterized protein n=1 Tax=Hymenobacter aranciens TaxID=3063996 RepID=A0ABT9B891_9BACT|nr:hypothetical protein [Hymenobacter sp. ASUV-10]MDO7874445.1 hypothetical protein [Hymenobacter sp. ASUV-10]